jgi:hypothetical protein
MNPSSPVTRITPTQPLRRIVVKYFDRRMFLTLDLQTLFVTLFDVYGDGANIEIAEMDEREKAESTEAVKGFQAIRERFRILETTLSNGVRRRKDLEELAVALGRK